MTSGVSLALALSGTFAAMAAASAITRLIVYLATCAATLRLRSRPPCRTVAPAAFVVPLGPVIPVTAIVDRGHDPGRRDRAAVLLCDRRDRGGRRAIPVRHPRRRRRVTATAD